MYASNSDSKPRNDDRTRCPRCGYEFGTNDLRALDPEALPTSHAAHRTVDSRWTVVATVITAALCALVIQTAVRIELGNARVGYYLPRTDEVAYGANPKWRYLPYDTESLWRQTRGPRDEAGKPVNRSLTVEETARMHQQIQAAANRNHLRWIVSTWGLLQYPAVLLLLVVARRSYSRAVSSVAKDVAKLGICVAVGAGTLMIYRGYYTSLGW
jgi:hypothetical protein